MRYLDAGESHGKGMACIVEGLPYGLPLRAADVESELARRRLGYGRSDRMALERDEVEIFSGVRGGVTLGSPLTMLVRNAEYEKWRDVMAAEGGKNVEALTALRPGHADLAGALKYGTGDLRDILERASARETVGRVCAGAAARKLLHELGINVYSHVLEVGGVGSGAGRRVPSEDALANADGDPMRCLEGVASLLMRDAVDAARGSGDSLGGIFEVLAFGLPAGLGSHVHWDRRLDGRIAAAVMGIQAVKGVEIGDGFEAARTPGSQAMDAIYYEEGRGFRHRSNHAGGLEGGMTNGEPLVVRAAMKPIPTMAKPMPSVDLSSGEAVAAAVERADVCAVPAAAVIAESCVAFVLAGAMLAKTGGDSIDEIRVRLREVRERQARI